MKDYTDLLRPDKGQDATSIILTSEDDFESFVKRSKPMVRSALAAQKFKGAIGEYAIIPACGDDDFHVIASIGEPMALNPWSIAKLSESLPSGTYRIMGDAKEASPPKLGNALLGWILGQYNFDQYLSEKNEDGPRILLTHEAANIGEYCALASATSLVRDMVNMPPCDMNPGAIEKLITDLAKKYDGNVNVIKGDILEQGYPLIYAVGKAASRDHAPRLIELNWGDEKHPKIAIVGKGVIFDTGGLNIKSGAGMRIMKKDMGGAAHAAALAYLIMTMNIPVRLSMLIPAVENAVAGNAMRPGDIIKARNGLSVEIDNTDAEGRLILADALTKSCEDGNEMVIDFATLTGAARVALGPDVPPIFANDDDMANAILTGAKQAQDPLWRMPLWNDYFELLQSDVADMTNSGGSFAGSVTAALFLQKFILHDVRWAHIDTFAWRPTPKPGRKKGGEALGLRAIYQFLKNEYVAK
ncbi:aminopeptidase [Sphingorhabdus lutea]|uniref:Aminopeptidase n=1 Tax=Sphingorhabdus lutea TaxID=1913578 RepID=A0A1L3JFE7_9SPHN|nr:leucyl aminopeptidase family protein [Sphingorhabdus lutea]APG63783.1 aminopeptidase [Sphingorhabdus lutea]